MRETHSRCLGPKRASATAFGVALLAFAGCGDGPDFMVPPPLPVVYEVPAVATEWIDANAHPLEGVHLSLPHDDLEFLRDVVGDATVVSLGDGTHGTRDFFEMKARILRFLVEEMGFDTFAIEATWPESRRLDHYVRTGEGDPEVLLSALYFWTWNTESVLEMIEWMRDHNEAGGDIGFHGFDMQFPGMALHNVREYVASVDPSRLDEVTEGMECLDRYANGPDGIAPSPRYGELVDTYRTDCGVSLDGVRSVLESNEAAYVAVRGREAFDVALQSLRVAFQFHLMTSGLQSRDESMAENTAWIHRQQGPGSRMVLWAHNNHVANLREYGPAGAQGFHLRKEYGADMVIVGFTHEQGRVTAARQFEDGGCGALGAWDLDPVVEGSYEHYFSTAAAPRFVLDLRGRNPENPATTWLAGSRQMRSIGACFNADLSDRYWWERPLADHFDVVIHLETTRPTVVLPRRRPDTF